MAGVVERATAKVGPLPVWAWALVLLVGGYLVYRLTAGKGSSSAGASTPQSDTQPAVDPDLTPVGGDTGNPVGSSGQGGAVDNLSADLYGQLTGLQGQIDELTAAVQLSPAFWPGGETGSAGSGSSTPNGATPAPKAKTKPAPKPAPKPSAQIRYYTYAPGKAPKGQKANEAPARGPAGTSLHFRAGKGYYYA